jgi:ketosteroid isomerase-like protein
MTQEGVELLKQSLEAIQRGDLAWFEGRTAPDLVIVQPPEVPDFKSYEGPNAVAEALADWPTQWEDFRMDLLEIIDVGDDVYVTATRHRGRGRESGIEMDFQVFYVTRSRDGQLARMEMFFSRDQALAAVGMAPYAGGIAWRNRKRKSGS